jgi:hypothetical protein
MNTPGFTAEASLESAAGLHREITHIFRTSGNLYPAAFGPITQRPQSCHLGWEHFEYLGTWYWLCLDWLLLGR